MGPTSTDRPLLLLLTLEYPPPTTGGSYRYLWNLVRFLPRTAAPLVITQRSVTCEATTADNDHPGIIDRVDFIGRPEGWQGWPILPRAWGWYRYALKAVKRDRPLLIVAGSVLSGGPAGYLLSRATGIPLIIVLYGEELSVAMRTRSKLKLWYKRLYFKLLLRRAEGLLVVSDYTAGLAQELGARPEQCFKITPPVGDELLAAGTLPEAYQRWRSTKDMVLLQTGRLVERKGQQLVIQCLPELLQQFPGLGYAIVGGGETEQALKQQAEQLKVTEAVYFAGQVSESELAAHYDDADLFVMPHRELPDGDTEGCGTVFLEAALHGVASVGGAAGGVHDAIVDGVTGVIVQAEDHGKLLAALAELLSNPGRRNEMGEAARSRVLAEFQAEDASARFADWCTAVVAAAGTGKRPRT